MGHRQPHGPMPANPRSEEHPTAPIRNRAPGAIHVRDQLAHKRRLHRLASIAGIHKSARATGPDVNHKERRQDALQDPLLHGFRSQLSAARGGTLIGQPVDDRVTLCGIVPVPWREEYPERNLGPQCRLKYWRSSTRGPAPVASAGLAWITAQASIDPVSHAIRHPRDPHRRARPETRGMDDAASGAARGAGMTAGTAGCGLRA